MTSLKIILLCGKEVTNERDSLYNFIYMKFWKSQNYIRRKQISHYREIGLVGDPQPKVMRKLFRAREIFFLGFGGGDKTI